jgi:hypothetical protein
MSKGVLICTLIGCAIATVARAETRQFHATSRNEAVACRDAQNHAAHWLNDNYVAITASHAETSTSRCDCVGDPQQGYTCTVQVEITRGN